MNGAVNAQTQTDAPTCVSVHTQTDMATVVDKTVQLEPSDQNHTSSNDPSAAQSTAEESRKRPQSSRTSVDSDSEYDSRESRSVPSEDESDEDKGEDEKIGPDPEEDDEKAQLYWHCWDEVLIGRTELFAKNDFAHLWLKDKIDFPNPPFNNFNPNAADPEERQLRRGQEYGIAWMLTRFDAGGGIIGDTVGMGKVTTPSQASGTIVTPNGHVVSHGDGPPHHNAKSLTCTCRRAKR